MKAEPLTKEEIAQMHINLIVFLEENGYRYVELADHFAVTIPMYTMKKSKLVTFNKK